jgi:hypothetical protein
MPCCLGLQLGRQRAQARALRRIEVRLSIRVTDYMNEEIWAGADLKVRYGRFHLLRMERSLDPPEQTAWNVAIEASGAIINTGWQQTLYAHFDAFLSVVKSVPEIVRCCFGVDLANTTMKAWFDGLSPAEQASRNGFSFRATTSRRAARADVTRSHVCSMAALDILGSLMSLIRLLDFDQNRQRSQLTRMRSRCDIS